MQAATAKAGRNRVLCRRENNHAVELPHARSLTDLSLWRVEDQRCSSVVDVITGQGERHDPITRGTDAASTPCGDGDVLASLIPVGHWSCLSAGGQRHLPEHFPGVDVKSTKAVVLGSADEDESTGGNQGPAESQRAELLVSAKMGE